MGRSLRFIKNKWFVLLLILLVVGGLVAFTVNKKPKTEYFTAKADRGDIREVVEATGTINAVTTVQVGSQVSGIIADILVDFNSRVKKGQVIARIDPEVFEGNLLQTRADLENAKANYAAAKANVEKALATAAQTRAEYERTARLAKEGVMSQQQLDVAKANAESADAQVSASRAQLRQAEAQVTQRQAAVKVAETNVGHTIIKAPIDGTVVNRAVDVGQTVAASFQAPTLFTIAQDLTKMQVYAKTDEADVGQIRRDQQVTFTVDAFPKETFRGKVVQVRMNPTTVQNVTTYDTIVEFDNPEMKLFPGMTAYITIPVAEVKNVLKVPNGALRYRPEMPADQLQALLQKYGMSDGAGRGGRAQAGAGLASGTRRQAAASDGEEPGGAVKEKREAPSDVATLWKLKADKSLEPVRIKTGVTDHTVSEVVQVLKGSLSEGDELVLGQSAARSSGSRAPSMGGPGGMRR